MGTAYAHHKPDALPNVLLKVVRRQSSHIALVVEGRGEPYGQDQCCGSETCPHARHGVVRRKLTPNKYLGKWLFPRCPLGLGELPVWGRVTCVRYSRSTVCDSVFPPGGHYIAAAGCLPARALLAGVTYKYLMISNLISKTNWPPRLTTCTAIPILRQFIISYITPLFLEYPYERMLVKPTVRDPL
jgi:hypothetical protein